MAYDTRSVTIDMIAPNTSYPIWGSNPNRVSCVFAISMLSAGVATAYLNLLEGVTDQPLINKLVPDTVMMAYRDFGPIVRQPMYFAYFGTGTVRVVATEVFVAGNR